MVRKPGNDEIKGEIKIPEFMSKERSPRENLQRSKGLMKVARSNIEFDELEYADWYYNQFGKTPSGWQRQRKKTSRLFVVDLVDLIWVGILGATLALIAVDAYFRYFS